MAILDYAQVVFVEVQITTGPTGPQIALDAPATLTSSALKSPHGVEFLDDDTVIVADRAGHLVVFAVPQSDAGPSEPLHVFDGDRVTPSPASVFALGRGTAAQELFVCDNTASHVTRHQLDTPSATLSNYAVVSSSSLNVADGVCVSADGRWLAVSSHDSHVVLVHDTAELGPDAQPRAVLRGAKYPHGVKFFDGGRRLAVSDAGAPYVHFFSRADAWAGAFYPESSLRVMDATAFERGHINRMEGGPKGIDIDPHERVLGITCETAPLAFFDLAGPAETVDAATKSDERLRYELQVLQDERSLVAQARDGWAAVAALEGRLAWRVTEPARRAAAWVRRFSRDRRRTARHRTPR